MISFNRKQTINTWRVFRVLPLQVVISVIFTALAVFAILNESRAQNNEIHYSKEWCSIKNGIAEVKLRDGSRCDCLTRSHAIEVEWPRKWTESIGQSLHYGNMTGKSPGIVFIVYDLDELRFIIKAFSIIDKYDLPIKTWIMWINKNH